MKSVVNIINQLESTSGTNDKIDIIKNNASNEDFKKVLQYTYSDDKMYGFSDKKLRKELNEFLQKQILRPIQVPPLTIWENGFAMLDALANANINNELREQTYKFLSMCSEESRELWIRVLTKDLRCKISAKTVNKAIPNLIFVWEIQQGHPIDKVKLKKDEWIALSLKLNGIRSTFFKGGFRSRQNKPMTGYQHIIDDIAKIEMLTGMVVDGELVNHNVDNLSDNENFRLTTSIVNSDADLKPSIQLVIFDFLPNEEFIQGESKKTFKARLEDLKLLEAKINELGITSLRVAPTYYTGTDHSKIKELLDEVDGKGLEGLMCLRDMPYKCKRHNGILKCKKFKEGDFKIIGFKEGNKDLQGTLGSLLVEFKGNTVGVSGYTDEMREEFWNNQDKYMGAIITVKYKEESKDKDTGLPSLQFPNFVCLRPDKTEPNY